MGSYEPSQVVLDLADAQERFSDSLSNTLNPCWLRDRRFASTRLALG